MLFRSIYALNDRGSARRMLKKYKEAEDDYTKAIALDKFQNAFLLNNRGTLRRDFLNNLDGAIEDYTNAIKIDTNYTIAYNNRGWAKYLKEDFKGAVEDYQKALIINSNYAFSWNNMGIAYFKLEQYSKAVEAYNEAIKIDPKYGNAYLNRGSAKELMKDFKGACLDWQKAKELGVEEAKDFLKDCK